MKWKSFGLAALAATTLFAFGGQNSHAKNTTPANATTQTTAKNTAKQVKFTSQIAKKYTGDYYAYMGADADVWYKLSIRPNQVSWSYVKANNRLATLYSYNAKTKKWVKATNHGTLWSTKGIKNGKTFTNKIGFFDNYNRYGATFNSNGVTNVRYVKVAGKVQFAMTYQYFKLASQKIGKKTYQTLVETDASTTTAKNAKFTYAGTTFLKNARVRQLTGKSYSQKQVKADLNKTAHYTTPKALRGTWYAAAGKNRWLVVKIGERSYESYLQTGKKITNKTAILPNNAGLLQLWVTSHKAGKTTYYTFNKANAKSSLYLGRTFVHTLKLNGKKQTALLISTQKKKNMVLTKHKYTKSFNFISQKDMLN